MSRLKRIILRERADKAASQAVTAAEQAVGGLAKSKTALESLQKQLKVGGQALSYPSRLSARLSLQLTHAPPPRFPLPSDRRPPPLTALSAFCQACVGCLAVGCLPETTQWGCSHRDTSYNRSNSHSTRNYVGHNYAWCSSTVSYCCMETAGGRGTAGCRQGWLCGGQRLDAQASFGNGCG